jgi:hypothetical protein
MTQVSGGEDTPMASLVGSLSAFGLPEILTLLATTRQCGELQVAGSGVEGRLLLDGGDISGATVPGSETLTDAVFTLALLQEGWFYFTVGQAPPSTLPSRQVSDLLAEVLPLVDEWYALLESVPLDAFVHLSLEAPGPEVQIRAEQWHILTTLGTTARSTQNVIDTAGEEPIATLRVLRDLAASGLVVVELPPPPPRLDVPPAPPAPPTVSTSTPSSWAPPPLDEEPVPLPAPFEGPGEHHSEEDSSFYAASSLADVAVMPPLGEDPWIGTHAEEDLGDITR